MTRRTLLAAAFASPALFARNQIGLSRISVITDEVAKTPADAIAFARQYGLQWVELRAVPGLRTGYATMAEPELRTVARELADAGLKVSFLNTALLKFGLPGSEPVRRREETPAAKEKRLAAEAVSFEKRLESLRKAIVAAHVFDVNLVRVFTFSRVAEPHTLFPRIADILGEMAKVAEKEGVRLLVENEGSCNVGTCEESDTFLKMLPARSVGFNWDPHNGVGLKDEPFPAGYAKLPKKRIANVQFKAKSLLEGPQQLPWDAIMRALEKDGYRGKMGLETHVFDGTLIEAAHASMKEIQKLVRST